MRHPLPVKDQQVGRCLHFFQGIKHYRAFAKGQQAGHVGKGNRASGYGVVNRVQALEVEHHHGSTGHVVTNADVNSGHVLHGSQARLALHLGGQIALHLKSLLWQKIPGMQHGQTTHKAG